MKSATSSQRVLLIFLSLFILGQGLAVSPKLDFGESGVIEVNREIKAGKIKGLRVTVDTSELKESKSSNSESSASSDSSETKKTVGVRTDVTFEITSGETNDTKTVDEKEIGKEDDNASIPVVPVFKGTPDRGGSSKDSIHNEILSVVPLENPASPAPPRRPVLPDERNIYRSNGAGGGVNRDGDGGWKPFPQFAIWTTERYNRRFDQPPPSPVFHHRGGAGSGQFDIYKKPSTNFIPYHMHHHGDHRHQHLPWEPCTCKEYPGPAILHPHQQLPEFKRTNQVDDKLERPFSKTTSRR